MSTALEIFWEQIDIARQNGDDDAATMALRRFSRARSEQVKPRPKMHTFNFGRRTHFMELRPRHLLMVEEYGFGPDYDRAELRTYFLANWNRLFGTIRKSKAHEVPSDQLRKELMVEQVLELIDETGRVRRRAIEISAAEITNTNSSRRRMYMPAG